MRRRRLRPIEPRELAARFAGRRLLLTITTGRSGTELLARALALHRGVLARHEPKPTFSSALRSVLAAPHVAREWWLAHKLPAILASRAPVYAETSHVACKGFLESLIELGVAPEILVLERAPRDVARSLCALGTIPGRTYGGVKYYLGPDDDAALPLEPRVAAELSNYQLCYWYCLEIAERARRCEARWAPRGVRFTRLDFATLAKEAGILALASRLDLPPLGALGRARARSLAATRVNARPDKKRALELGPDAELEREEASVRAHVGARAIEPAASTGPRRA